MASTLTDIQLETAWSVVRYAQEVRAYHRRTTERGATARETDIEMALNRIKRAMKPVRSFIARAPHLDPMLSERITMAREVSKALQSERRKLWKMQDPKKRAARQKRNSA